MLRLSLSLPPSNTILNLSIHGKNHAKILGKGGRLPLEVIKCCNTNHTRKWMWRFDLIVKSRHWFPVLFLILRFIKEMNTWYKFGSGVE